MELISTDNGASAKKTLSVFSGIASAFGGLIAGIWAVGLIAHILGGLNVWMAIAVVPLGICFGVGIGYVFYRGWLFPSSFYVIECMTAVTTYWLRSTVGRCPSDLMKSLTSAIPTFPQCE